MTEIKDVWKSVYAKADELKLTKDQLGKLVKEVFGKRADTAEEAGDVLRFLDEVEIAKKAGHEKIEEAIEVAKGVWGSSHKVDATQAKIGNGEKEVKKDVPTQEVKSPLWDVKPPGEEVDKTIEIEWDKIPAQYLIPKLRGALNYKAELEKGGVALVRKSDGTTHSTSKVSCDCPDFKYRGTSLNPCVHQCRMKYTDDEIRAMLKELGAEGLPAERSNTNGGMVKRQEIGMGITTLQPQLAIVGGIKIGEKSQVAVKGYFPPKKLDHIIITKLTKDPNGRLDRDEEMMEKIGEDCKMLPIVLCYDDLLANMPNFYAAFVSSRLECRGDGRCALLKDAEGNETAIPCKPLQCERYIAKKCKPYGILSVILPDANVIGGVYAFRTQSWLSIRNVLSSMKLIRDKTGGILGGLPLQLRILPVTLTPKGLGKNVLSYVVNVEFKGSQEELLNAAMLERERRRNCGIDMAATEVGDRSMIIQQAVANAEEEAADITEYQNGQDEEGY